jgi:hypothetical protein
MVGVGDPGRHRPEAIAFLRFRPELLSQPDRDAHAFPSPRSWEFVSRILDSLGSQANPAIGHEVIAGAVGTAAATELSGFLSADPPAPLFLPGAVRRLAERICKRALLQRALPRGFEMTSGSSTDPQPQCTIRRCAATCG